MRRRLGCTECGAEFTLVWDLDADYYVPTYCSFCGTELEEEMEDELDDE
jgi:DNA-directed RNA polymerase subunit RPC12/RpoP